MQLAYLFTSKTPSGKAQLPVLLKHNLSLLVILCIRIILFTKLGSENALDWTNSTNWWYDVLNFPQKTFLVFYSQEDKKKLFFSTKFKLQHLIIVMQLFLFFSASWGQFLK